ncbi:MAG: hypothetical protein LBP22_06860 [Deltaproteobacteria bacterium]|nr:hypothetical protein [Deltaproteobacteria bacterium]
MADYFKNSQIDLSIKEIKLIGQKNFSDDMNSLLGYLKHHSDHIDYAAYIKKVYFIGSGATESANKSVVQSRLKQPGMRWNIDCGQWAVSLIAKAKSDLWETEVENAINSHFGIS